MKTKKPTYQAASEELKAIVRSLEASDLNIDQMAEKVEKATALIQYCKEKLRAIEDEVNQAMGEEDSPQ
jgi:exodeoxyribonuclease VII small subunit